ncbi:uncharacterized protein GVI51_J08393 [Nakaseomyces glabratus]|uniref:AB hydrolase-1 domain-containing protein n=1 Tax=Candida glabrata (strain ATCC 2001 / BCRC 20586 / JCM 3761 / NBRC 0622 / NRRL Y-65 / CBS 138) TaxID=284593 RepID=Q6FNW5_CANGA|nr:uncharacterized protein CAGL0J08547g [Nakaseomyces glabratus]KAH7598498.1 Alpha/beta hydrolase family [Nakaseomyces glabratus]KAH7604787.1 Alpha/beta hydrolase family [Nakaseomyces glabratus]KAJ9571986.1 hypothetical protein LTX96_0001529 [Nakaseomyces glabratus]QHS67733.1 uncharacterized protein GVI51_J08393 [Nakaseomyces glabratus]CAG61030.1 unnamed protein product [Nakaseomyces glabratus]|eukprot:XP_448079.1 uncharacterized protein CAGL0J08547g [[Candida] glabrata]
MEARVNEKYEREVKTTAAVWPRSRNAVLNPDVDRLCVVYEVFTRCTGNGGSKKKKVNLVFCHGSGMNRAIWEYHADRIADLNSNWVVDKIVVIDQVNHGDSALLNKGRLGLEFDWFDGARDICKVAEEEFNFMNNYNVIVGHSMGGFQTLAAVAHNPNLFQLAIVIEPVIIKDPSQLEPKTEYLFFPPNFYRALTAKMTDNFDSMQEFEEFMEKKSFYVKVHPEIRKRLTEFEAIQRPDGSVVTKMKKVHNFMCYATDNTSAKRMVQLMPFIGIPVVSLVGASSRWTPPVNNEYVRTRIPNCKEVSVANGDHLMNLEMPDTIVDYISKHISQYVANPPQRSEGDYVLDHNGSLAERNQFLDNSYKHFLNKIRLPQKSKL